MAKDLTELKSNPYWKRRLDAEIQHQMALDYNFEVELQRLHELTRANLMKEINNLLYKYSDKTGFTLKEARRLADGFDVESFLSNNAKRRLLPEYQRELDLYHLKTQLSRAELLLAQLDSELLQMLNDEYLLADQFINNAFIQELNRNLGLLGLSAPIAEEVRVFSRAILNVPYHDATWSETIWKHQAELRVQMAELAEATILRGRNSMEFAERLKELFEVERWQVKRLVVTETARVQSEVQMESYRQAEIDQYLYFGEPSACSLCKRIANGGPYDVTNGEPGKNLPPMHPHCRCWTVPYLNRAELDEMFKRIETELV